MIKRVSPRTLSVTVLCLMMLGTLWGCSGKRVASSSGDATSTTKEKSAAAPVETIKPESMATIPATPEDRPSTLEASRAPLDVPPSSSRSTESPSPSAPSSFAAREGPGLGDIFFDFDQYAIRRDAQPVLEADAAWIKSGRRNRFSLKDIATSGVRRPTILCLEKNVPARPSAISKTSGFLCRD